MGLFSGGFGLTFWFKMLVLFETPAGFALFKVLDEGKLSKVEVICFFVLLSCCSLLIMTHDFWHELESRIWAL